MSHLFSSFYLHIYHLSIKVGVGDGFGRIVFEIGIRSGLVIGGGGQGRGHD